VLHELRELGPRVDEEQVQVIGEQDEGDQADSGKARGGASEPEAGEVGELGVRSEEEGGVGAPRGDEVDALRGQWTQGTRHGGDRTAGRVPKRGAGGINEFAMESSGDRPESGQTGRIVSGAPDSRGAGEMRP